WWKRQTRTGYGGLDIVTRFEQPDDPLFAPQLKRSRRLAIGYPVLLVAAFAIGAMVGGKWIGLAALLVAAMSHPLQILRLAWRDRNKMEFSFALIHGTFTMIAKWAQLLGQYR